MNTEPAISASSRSPNPSGDYRWLWLSFVLAGLIGVAAWGLPALWRNGVVRSGSYPALLVLVGVTSFWLFRVWREPRLGVARLDWRWPDLLAIAAATGLLLAHDPFGFKILMDEYILAAIAQNFHMQRDGGMINLLLWEQGTWIVDQALVDKRPLLYPFLVSLIHDLTGYRPENGIALNVLMTPVLVGLVYGWGRLVAGRSGALLALAALASIPLVGQNATGAGFDLLNMTLLAGLLVTAWLHWQQPSANRLNALIGLTGLLACTRYESVLFFLPVGCLIWLVWRRERSAGRPLPLVPAWMPAVLVLLTPLVFQQRAFQQTTRLWELPAETERPFSLAYVPDNVAHALAFFFNPGTDLPNSLTVAVIGLFFLLLYGVGKLSRWQRPAVWSATDAVLIVLGGGLLLHFGVILSYHAGALDAHFASRFSLPAWLGLIAVLPTGLAGIQRRGRLLGLLGALLLAGYFWQSAPAASRAAFTRENFAAREATWVVNRFADEPDPAFLVVAHGDVYLTAHRIQSMEPARANLLKDRLAFYRGPFGFREIYVVEHFLVDPADGSVDPFPEPRLDPAFERETLAERSFRPYHLTRLSRVTAIRTDEPQQP